MACGTLSICRSCIHKACCTSIQADGLIERAVATSDEISSIERSTGKLRSEFSVPHGNGKLRFLSVNASVGCAFLGPDKTCTIYKHRPFDCRIFPFDLKFFGDVLWWITHEKFCGAEEPDRLEKVSELERMISRIPLDVIEDFARIEMGLSERKPIWRVKKFAYQ